MANESNSGISPTIVAAFIALIGVLGAAAINNWDKLFPRTQSAKETEAVAQRSITTGTNPPVTGAPPRPVGPVDTAKTDPPAVQPTVRTPNAERSAADTARATTAQRWRDLKNQLKRRLDQVPNLVEAAQSSSKPSLELAGSLRELQLARAAVYDPALQPDDRILTDATRMATFARAQMRVTKALAQVRLMTAASDSANLQAIQSQLDGIQNRMAVAVADYNQAVEAFDALADTGVAPMVKYQPN